MCEQILYVKISTNPSFCSLQTSFPIPNALRNPGLVDVVHRLRGGPRVTPGGRRPPLTGGMRSSCFTHCCQSPVRVPSSYSQSFGFALVTSISPRTTAVPHYPSSNNSSTARMVRKGLNQTKKIKSNNLQQPKSGINEINVY